MKKTSNKLTVQSDESISHSFEKQINIDVTQEAGQAIVQEAIYQIRDNKTKSVINFVSHLMRDIESWTNEIEKITNYISFARRRIQAIEDGKFSFPRNGSIIFEEDELNG